MWLLLQGWLFRNVLALLGWLAPRLPSPPFSSAPGRPAAMPSASRPCGGRWRCNVTSSRLRAAVLAIAVSLLAGCATEPSDGAPCPPVVNYSREFLARAADELASLPAGSAMEQMLADYHVMRDQARACRRFGERATSAPLHTPLLRRKAGAFR